MKSKQILLALVENIEADTSKDGECKKVFLTRQKTLIMKLNLVLLLWSRVLIGR